MEVCGEKKKEIHVILSANRNTLQCVLKIQDATTIVDFKVDNRLRSVLGFNAKQYKNPEDLKLKIPSAFCVLIQLFYIVTLLAHHVSTVLKHP